MNGETGPFFEIRSPAPDAACSVCVVIRGELAIRRGTSRHTLVFGGFHADPNHDAVMRIGGKAPRRQAHSLRRRASHACLGSPPPRTIMGISSSTVDGTPNLAWLSAPQWQVTLPVAGRRPLAPLRSSLEIGRASCRERVWKSAAAGSGKNKHKNEKN